MTDHEPMTEAKTAIAAALKSLELYSGRTVQSIDLRDTCIRTVNGDVRYIRDIEIALSERPGEGWGV